MPHTSRYSVPDSPIDLTLDDSASVAVLGHENEWLGLLAVADLMLEELCGGFACEPVIDDSREYVFSPMPGY